jgi:hypothetical protein
MLAYDIVPRVHLMLHTCMTHDILLFMGYPTYVKSNQSKDINYKVVESKLKKSFK